MAGKRILNNDTKLKMSDFMVKGSYYLDNLSRNVTVVEAVKLVDDFDIPDNQKKYFAAANNATGGICALVYQELFKVAYREQHMRDEEKDAAEGLDWSVEKVRVPAFYQKHIGSGDVHRLDFKWGNLIFKNAIVLLAPGQEYYLPKIVAADLRMYLESKLATPEYFGIEGEDGAGNLDAISSFESKTLADFS